MKNMENYWNRPCRALIKYENGKTKSLLVNYGFRPKKGKLIALWSVSTGKEIYIED